MHGWDNVVAGGGVTLMLVGMVVVFSALVVLLFLMKGLKRFQELLHGRKVRRQQQQGSAADSGDPNDYEEIPGVVAAAIALTLILEEESVHDDESLVLTLNNLPKPYSNWWQSRIDRDAWPARITPGRAQVLGRPDPTTDGEV